MRRKMVFTLIVYCAGFLTAIYFLAPIDQANENGEIANTKTEEIATKVNTQLHKYVGVAKDAAKDLGVFIKEKIDDKT